MIETDFPAAARALRANLGIGEEEKLTIPNIAISVEKLRQEIKQEREAREQAEKAAEHWRQSELRIRRERDRYATILELASRFAAASPETQIKDDGGGVIDGRWLASHICDVLEGEA